MKTKKIFPTEGLDDLFVDLKFKIPLAKKVKKSIIPAHELIYKTGNVLEVIPNKGETIFLLNICTTYGRWNKGYQTKLGNKFPKAKKKYREMYRRITKRNCTKNIPAGIAQLVKVHEHMYVVNLICQKNPRSSNSRKITIDYTTLNSALSDFAIKALKESKETKGTIAIPRIGCGIEGGHWNKIENKLKKVTYMNKNLSVVVYDLPKKKKK